MSVKAIDWAWEVKGLSSTQRLVLLSLADHFNEDRGAAWPGVDRMAKRCCLSDRAIQTNLKVLRNGGLVTLLRREGKRNYYSLNREILALTPERGSPLPPNLTTLTPEPPSGVPPNLTTLTPERGSPELKREPLIKSLKEVSKLTLVVPTDEKIFEEPDNCEVACNLLTLYIKDHKLNRPELKDEIIKTTLKRWKKDIYKINDSGHSWETIFEVIHWCYAHSFWHKNILSGYKLFDQFQRLLDQIHENQEKFGMNGTDPRQSLIDRSERRERVEKELLNNPYNQEQNRLAREKACSDVKKIK